MFGTCRHALRARRLLLRFIHVPGTCHHVLPCSQVASQIVGHVLAVLGDKGPANVSTAGSDSQHSSPSSSNINVDAQMREAAAVVDLLQELIVGNAHVLGDNVLAGLPPLPQGVMTQQLAQVQEAGLLVLLRALFPAWGLQLLAGVINETSEAAAVSCSGFAYRTLAFGKHSMT